MSSSNPKPPSPDATSPVSPTKSGFAAGQHHTYESFSDLVPSSPPPGSASPRRGFFGSPVLGNSSSGKKNKRASGWRGSFSGWGGGGVDDGDSESGAESPQVGGAQAQEDEAGDSLSTWRLILLTVGLLGAQLTWTVEMAFGTPYLLTLGLTKQSTSLVWLAGPLSGLIAQPVVGAPSLSAPRSTRSASAAPRAQLHAPLADPHALSPAGALSDSSRSRYRRRAFVLGSGVLIIVSTLFVAYARELAALIASLSGLGDWDPDQEETQGTVAIVIGVVGFYVLDFSLNGLQASLRALILDQAPTHQQNVANAWQGRMTHIANIVGYSAGYLDLGHNPAMHWIGGGQFRKLAVLSCTVMALAVGTTCYTQKEKIRPKRGARRGKRSQVKEAFKNVKDNISMLPLAVRRVCFVQLCAWTAWFPFLFYSTTYVAETLYASVPPGEDPPEDDTATRAGSAALLMYALVALASGTVLPILTRLGEKPFVERWISRSSKRGRATRHVLALFTLRNFWTMGLLWYAVGMMATFWINDVEGAMLLVAFLGVPWAIACWIPFALVMEAIRDLPSPPPSPPIGELEDEVDPDDAIPKPATAGRVPFRRAIERASSFQPTHPSERTPLINATPDNSEPPSPDVSISGGGAERGSGQSGGTILGIHNLAIVAPQFFVAIVAAAIFKLADTAKGDPTQPGGGGGPGGGGEEAGGEDGGLRGSNDVVWVLRFGGLAALVGVAVSRWVISPRSEVEYVEDLLAWRERAGDEERGAQEED